MHSPIVNKRDGIWLHSDWSSWSRLFIYYSFAGSGSPAWKRPDKRDVEYLLLLSFKGLNIRILNSVSKS